jgi:hypothetical protein
MNVKGVEAMLSIKKKIRPVQTIQKRIRKVSCTRVILKVAFACGRHFL